MTTKLGVVYNGDNMPVQGDSFLVPAASWASVDVNDSGVKAAIDSGRLVVVKKADESNLNESAAKAFAAVASGTDQAGVGDDDADQSQSTHKDSAKSGSKTKEQ